MTREEMMDMIIKQYGFENNITITFCILAEDPLVSDEVLWKAFDTFMA